MRRLPFIVGVFVLLAVYAFWVASLPTGAVASPGGVSEKEAGRSPKGGCPPSWQLVSSPEVTGTFHSLYGLTVISSTDAWAVGDTSEQWDDLVEHWDGERWSVVPPAPVLTANASLSAIDATGSNDVWIAGSYAGQAYWQPLVEHWNGSQWSIMPIAGVSIERPYLLHAIAAITPSDAWAVGYVTVSVPGGSRAVTLIAHWDGVAWQVVTSPNASTSSNALYAVSGTSPSDVWAVGRYRAPEGVNLPLTMHWDGTAWTIVPSPFAALDVHEVRGVEAIAPNDVWLVGNYLQQGFLKTLTAHWDGSQWYVVPSPNPVQNNHSRLRAVYATATNDVWAVGYYNDGYYDRPLTMHWDGIQWTIVPAPDRDRGTRLQTVDGSPDGDLWAGGMDYEEYNLGEGSNIVYMRYTTACPPPTVTPTPTPSASPSPTACTPGLRLVPAPAVGSRSHMHAVYAVSPSDMWAVGEYRPEPVGRVMPLIEHWNGIDWSIVPGNPSGLGSSRLWGVDGTASNDVWAVGEYTDPATQVTAALAKHWDGTAWADVPVPSPGALANILRDVVALAPNNVWAAGSYANQVNDWRTLIVHWNGAQWTVVASPNPGNPENSLNAIAAGPAGDLWAVGYKQSDGSPERPLVLRWNGTSWQAVIEALENDPYGGQLSDIAVDEEGAWAVGWRVNGPSYSSREFLVERWDGTNWSVAPSSGRRGSQVHSVAVGVGTDAWALGTMTGIPVALHWNGHEWGTAITPHLIGGGYELEEVLLLPGGEVWAVGGASSGPMTAVNDRSCTCAAAFADVPAGSAFYPYVTCLACRQIVSGYPCGGPGEPCDPLGNAYYRPNAHVTRGQLAKIVSLASSETYIEPGRQSFQDVPPGSPFWLHVEIVRLIGYVSGYPCGGPGEPCIPPENRPYFRPGANASRGQIAKIIASATMLTHNVWDTQQTFEDVAPGSTFWQWVEGLADAGVIGGYPCGGPGEPCGPENRPYFRPNNPTTRGQMAKFAANAFFPYCVNLRP